MANLQAALGDLTYESEVGGARSDGPVLYPATIDGQHRQKPKNPWPSIVHEDEM